MIKIFRIVILLFISSSFFGQVSGYLGKRISIEGDIGAVPDFIALIGYGHKKYKITYDSFSGKYIYESKYIYPSSRLTMILNSRLKVGYCLSDKAEISFSINRIRNKFTFRNYSGTNRDWDEKTFYTIDKLQVKYNVLEYGINLKIYRGEFIAPLGKFVTFGVGIVSASAINREDLKVTYLPKGGGFPPETVQTNSDASFFKLNIGIGKSLMISDKISFKYLAEFNWYSFNKYRNTKGNYYSVKSDLENLFGYNVGWNLIRTNFFNAKIGFGIFI